MTNTVKLIPPNGDTSNAFNIKANSVEREIDTNVIIDTVVANISKHIAGGEVTVDIDKVVVMGEIQNMTADDYPNSAKYDGSDENHPDDDDYGFEQEITTAARTWSPEVSFEDDNINLPELKWDGRSIKGHISTVRTTERMMDQSDVGRTYDLEIEFLNIDIDTRQE